MAPWRRAAEDRGLAVRTVPFDRRTLQLDYDALEAMLSRRTRLVAMGAASNAVGTINDVARVAEAAHRVGALCFVDAVHYAPHQLPDVAALGCDFLACSAYKFFGPHVGILWGRSELLERTRAYKVPPAPDTAGERWETGTQNHEGIAGVGVAVEWLAQLSGGTLTPGSERRAALEAAYRGIAAHEDALFATLRGGLAEIAGVRVFGPPAETPRTPTLGFTVAGQHADAVARTLAGEGIFVWSGHFYATSVTAALGLDEAGGLVRAGLAPYNTADDVERLLAAIRIIARG